MSALLTYNKSILNTLYAYSSTSTTTTFNNINLYIKRKIVLDSGATEHYTCNKDWLINYKPISNKDIQVANGDKLSIKGIGNIPIIINSKEILITKVNYIPELQSTLISPKELANKGWTILFKDNIADLSYSKLNFNIKAEWDQNAYYLDLNINAKALEPVLYRVDKIISNTSNTTTNINKELNLFHKRLNYINKDYLIKTLNEHTINTYSKDNNKPNILSDCESCHIGKFHKKVSYKPLKAPKDILTFFDIDICGPFKIIGLLGERYFFTFTCRKTRAIWVYAIKTKAEAIDILATFINLILN